MKRGIRIGIIIEMEKGTGIGREIGTGRGMRTGMLIGMKIKKIFCVSKSTTVNKI